MNTATYHRLGPNDLHDLHALRDLYRNVFQEEMPPISDKYLQKLLDGEAVLFFVAKQGNTILGGATAYRLPSLYGERDELYMYDMAVDDTFQRIGIGSGLLGFIKEYCQNENIKDLYVQADTLDTHARNFYKKNGGVEIDVRHYDFSL